MRFTIAGFTKIRSFDSALFAAGIALCAISITPTRAEDTHHSISFDSGYINSQHSNRAFNGFAMEYLGLFNAVWDFGAESSFVAGSDGARIAWAGLGAAAVYFARHGAIETPLLLAIHESGHSTRMSAAGSAYQFGFPNSGTRYKNFFEYFLAAQAQRQAGGFTEGVGTYPGGHQFEITAGGINTAQYLGHAFEEEAYTGHAHFLDGYMYVTAKLNGSDYVDNVRSYPSPPAGSDINALVNEWNARGLNINFDDIKSASQLSVWGSAHTYNYLVSLLRYIAVGDPYLHSLELASFRLPDVDTYLNPTGISAKIKSGYRAGDYVFPFAVEYVYLGQKQTEFSLAARQMMAQGALRYWQLGATVGAGVGLEASLALRTGSALELEVGVDMWSARTLEGARQTTHYAGDSTVHGWGKASLVW